MSIIVIVLAGAVVVATVLMVRRIIKKLRASEKQAAAERSTSGGVSPEKENGVAQGAAAEHVVTTGSGNGLHEDGIRVGDVSDALVCSKSAPELVADAEAL